MLRRLNAPTRTGRKGVTPLEWLAIAVAIGSSVMVFRARANQAWCAFLPLAVPAVALAGSQVERRRAARAVRAGWGALGGYRAGGPTPWIATLAFVVIPVFLLNMSNNHVEVVGDTSTVVPTAVSLLSEGNADLDEFLEGSWWQRAPVRLANDGLSEFLKRRRGHVYPAHASGMVMAALPVVALARVAGARVSDRVTQLRLEKLTAALMGALTAGVFFLLALQLSPPDAALVATALLAAGSGMLSTVGQNLWQHDGIALGSLTLLLIESRRPGRFATVAQGLICGAMASCRLTAIGFLLPFGVWVLLRSPGRAVAIVGCAALGFVPWALYYFSVYGSPFGPSVTMLEGGHWSSGSFPARLLGVLFSPGRGLLVYQPWLLLALGGVLVGNRKGLSDSLPRGWAAVCLAALVAEVVIVSAWCCWWGGSCWGSRLLMGVVPVAALVCVRPIEALLESRRGRCLVATLAVLGFLAQAPVVYAGSFRWNETHLATQELAVWSWPDAPFLEPFHRPAPGPLPSTRPTAPPRVR